MIDRRQFLGGSAAVICGLGLAACGGNAASDDSAQKGSGDDAQRAKLIVFAAASMTESLTKAGDEFMAENQGYELSFNYDSSGTLKTQIQEGADCDVFISAGQKQMNALDAEAEKGNDEGLDFVDHATRFDILENKVTLVVPEGNPKKIIDFNDLAERLKSGEILLSMGNSDVPVGQYTQKILAYYELDEEALAKAGCITYGTNVKEVTSQVGEGAVDCGHLQDRRVLRGPHRGRRGHQGDVRPGRLPRGRDEERAAGRGRQALPRVPQGYRGLQVLQRGRLHPARHGVAVLGQNPPSLLSQPTAWMDGRMDWHPLYNSVRIAAVSTAIMYFLGIFLANVVA